MICGGMFAAFSDWDDVYQDEVAIKHTAATIAAVTIANAGLRTSGAGLLGLAAFHSFSKLGVRLCCSSDSSENSA